MAQQLTPIRFHADTVYLTEREGEPYVPVRPLVDNLAVAWKPQYVKLTKQPNRWRTVTIMVTVAADAKNREMVCLPLRKVPAFLCSIDPRKVRKEARRKLELYQDECDDVLWKHWTEGAAVNPRIEPPVEPAVPPDMTLVPKDRYIELLESHIALLQPSRKAGRRQWRRISDREIASMRQLRAEGMSVTAIAKLLGRHKSAVSIALRLRLQDEGGTQ